MIENIIKRRGDIVPFDASKIETAIWKAAEETGEFAYEMVITILNEVIDYLDDLYDDEEYPGVEEIQDVVEQMLVSHNFYYTAKAYIVYREKRSQVRDFDKALDVVDEYLGKTDWKIRENSNNGYSVQGMNNYVTGIVMSKYWLERVYPKDIKQAHMSGEMHIHDLSMISAYCVGWDLYALLQEGFGGVDSKLTAGPAKHFDTALGQIWNFLFTLQAEAAGAQAVSSFDTLLAPFVRADGLTYDDVKQRMQQFIYNMNVSTRVGFAAPFTNITMDLSPSPNYKDQAVIIGGVPQDTTYGEYQEEMDMINKAYAEVMLNGDYLGNIFSFPIPTYNLTRDLDFGSRRLDPVWRMTGKYGTPNWSNFMNSDLKPEDTRSMCCRLNLDTKKLNRRTGGMFASAPLTGSIGVVTLNLPRIGYMTSGSEDAFFSRLREVFDKAQHSLAIKRGTVEALTEQGLYPYSRHYLSPVKAQTGKYWSNHFETIGIVGMNEALLNFMGQGIHTVEGKAFADRVMDTLIEWIDAINEEDDRLINLEATPAEGVCYRLARQDVQDFGDCHTQGSGEEVFYTNSTHLPVDATSDIFEALKHQESLQCKYTGGTTLHGFIGEEITDVNTVRNLVYNIATNFRLPYFTITPTFSVCKEHGYLSGEHHTCPKCGAPAEVFSRVVGYYRPISSWNNGKQSEFRQRKVYEVE